MPKNQQFAALLTGLNNNPHLAANPGYKDALDALLRADHNNANAFRAALFAHKAVWIALGAGALLDGDFVQNDTTDNLFSAAENTPGQQFADLYKLAAQKRVELAMTEANEAVLSTIITQINQQGVRQQLATAPLTALVGDTAQWFGGLQNNNQNHITDAAVVDIQQGARRALLIQKIKAAPYTDQTRQQLESLLGARANDGNFRTAAQNLGITDAGVRNTLNGNLLANGNELEKVALRKAFELRVQHQFAADFANLNNTFNLLDVQPRQFNPLPGTVYNQKFQNDADDNWARGVLGSRYLKEKLAVYEDVNGLLQVAAAATDTATLRTVLVNTGFDPNNHYVGYAVTDSNAKELRQLAAVQALKLNIAACGDATALRALADARDIGTLRSVLEKHPALGFSGAGNSNARNALSEPNALSAVLGAAYVRSQLFSAQPEHLKTMVAGNNFATNFKQLFVPGTSSPLIIQAVDEYLSKPANIIKSREDALTNLLRAKVKSLDEAELNPIANISNLGNFQNAFKINKLMGVGNAEADDLLHNAAPASFIHGLAGLAKAEAVLNSSKRADMTDGNVFNAVINYINTFSHNGQASIVQTRQQALSPADQNNFRKQLLEIVLDKYPLTNPGHAPIARLNDLIQAKDANDVKVKLANMGITVNLDWIDAQLAADLQRKAAARAVSGHINAHSAFPLEAHPQLQAFLSNLNLDKQKASLAKPDVLGALMTAKSIDEIRRIVGATNSSAGDLVAENERLLKLSQLFNPALARVLAAMQPPFPVSDSQINAINQTILSTNPFDANNNVYRNFVNELRTKFNPQDKTAFNQAFGLDAQGLAIAVDAIRRPIADQHTRNQHLVTRVNAIARIAQPAAAEIKEKAAIEMALCLNKAQDFAQHEIQNFRDVFENAATLNNAIADIIRNDTINANLGNTGWQQQITPDLFASYKRVQKQQEWTDGNNYRDGVMVREQDEILALKTTIESITKIDRGYRQELLHLGNLTKSQWLSPEFEVAARQKYKELHPRFKEFARDCDIILEELRRQQTIYEDKLNALPDTSAMVAGPQKTDIDNFRKQLKAGLDNVNNGISYYEKASLSLNGNPSAPQDSLARKGLIQHLEDCKNGANVIFTSTSMSYSDFPASEISQHLDKTYKPGPGKQVGTGNAAISTQAQKTYIVDKLEPGMCREYVLSGEMTRTQGNRRVQVADTGTFIEQVHARHLDPKTVNKKTEVTPNATVTVAQFPQEEENRIKYSMAMASQLLAHLDHAPTKERPLVITGSNPEQLRHLWTTLMVLAKNNPKMKFDHNAIQVASTAFDPANEMGKVYGFNSNALYNEYMKNPTIKQMVAGIKTFTESKEAEKSSTTEVTKKIASMLQQFKTEGAQQTLDKLEKDLKTKRGPTLGSS